MDPDLPIVEGDSAPIILDWLAPYVPAMPDVRASLTTYDQVYFDMLWRRATGVELPALSSREREVLMGFFN